MLIYLHGSAGESNISRGAHPYDYVSAVSDIYIERISFPDPTCLQEIHHSMGTSFSSPMDLS